MIDLTCRILASIAFFFLGLTGWIQGDASFGEIFSDISLLWDDGEPDVYYGIQFE